MANENIISGLLTEKDGYAARIKQAEAVNDDEKADYYRSRSAQVDAELKKHGHKATTAKAAVVEDAK